MTELEVELMVLGAGSGGVRAARLAAQRGARVAVAESGPTGGTCVNVGCIPKKLYSYAAHFADSFHEAPGFGWPATRPMLDWSVLKARRAAEIHRLNGIYDGVLSGAGAQLLQGWARLTGPNSVEVVAKDGSSGWRVTARHILVATGGHATRPDFPGADLAVLSDDMFDLPVFPRRLVVIGGGYIASEMASIFHGLGAVVHQVVRHTALLRGFDTDTAAFLAQEMQKKGVQLKFGRQPLAIARDGEDLKVQLDDGTLLLADTVLLATGRGPNTRGLGLAEAGVALSPTGAVQVDGAGQSNLASVHAVGDVTDGPQLTPGPLA
jgi:glutathione reductase (NADPH)